jgi:hypothetical protein
LRDGAVALAARYRGDLDVDAVNVYRGSLTTPFTRIASLLEAPPDRFDYTDRTVKPNTTYRYQIGVVDADGEFFSPIVSVTTPSVVFALEQNQPNPFNPTTTIRFVVPAAVRAVLSIYSTDGRLVRTLFDDVATPGANEVTWDGRDASGTGVSSGVYFYRLSAGKSSATRKMVLLK